MIYQLLKQNKIWLSMAMLTNLREKCKFYPHKMKLYNILLKTNRFIIFILQTHTFFTKLTLM